MIISQNRKKRKTCPCANMSFYQCNLYGVAGVGTSAGAGGVASVAAGGGVAAGSVLADSCFAQAVSISAATSALRASLVFIDRYPKEKQEW